MAIHCSSSKTLTGPRKETSSCVRDFSCNSRQRSCFCKNSLNSINSPCISATCNSQSRFLFLFDDKLLNSCVRYMSAALCAASVQNIKNVKFYTVIPSQFAGS